MHIYLKFNHKTILSDKIIWLKRIPVINIWLSDLLLPSHSSVDTFCNHKQDS